MGLRTTSLVVTMIAILILTLGAGIVYRQMRERIALLSANENERILNMLLASLRDHDDFGSAIESGVALSERVDGVAVYLENGEPLYSWGNVPSSFSPKVEDLIRDGEFVSRDLEHLDFESSREGQSRADPVRFVIPDAGARTQRFVIRSSRLAPPPHGRRPAPDADASASEKKSESFFFNVLSKGEWLYIDVRHPEYWRERTLLDFIFPLAGISIIVLAFYMRFLALKNVDYRERIERQKNLVVLGTAASTLAHEIKNPLLAIRLQTGILEKIGPEGGKEELGIINAEIDRLSELTYRINDYLREPKGSPVDLPVGDFVRGAGRSLCGRDPVSVDDSAGLSVRVDPDRFRSALGNVVRNALESGGDPKSVEIEIRRDGQYAVIDILDRGAGISPDLFRNLFEPFFTTKSRGTGIGLSITKRFVEAVGGTVVLSARDGGGTRARMRIPISGSPS